MKVITFANVKGGVGKTTATIMTALALSRRGYRVIVKDLDPWGSAYDWSSRAKEAGTPLPFPVRTAIARNITDPEDARDCDFLLVDTPQDIRNAMSEAIDRVSDIIVIVAKPGSLDTERTLAAVDSFASPRAILLNFANPRQKSTRQAIDLIGSKHLARFDTLIPQRESVHNASNGGNQVPTDSGFIEFTSELLELPNIKE